jgi:hypothetical protein
MLIAAATRCALVEPWPLRLLLRDQFAEVDFSTLANGIGVGLQLSVLGLARIASVRS